MSENQVAEQGYIANEINKPKSFDKFVFSAVSILLHPILMPFYAYMALSRFSNLNFLISIKESIYVSLTVLITTVLIPMGMLFFMKKAKIISSYKMQIRHERIYPLSLMIMIYLATYLYIQNSPVFFIASTTLLFSIITSVISLGITYFFKISLHCLGLTTMVSLLTMLSLNYGFGHISIVISGILLLGLVGTARLGLNAHKSNEVYWGYAVGILIGLIIYKVAM